MSNNTSLYVNCSQLLKYVLNCWSVNEETNRSFETIYICFILSPIKIQIWIFANTKHCSKAQQGIINGRNNLTGQVNGFQRHSNNQKNILIHLNSGNYKTVTSSKILAACSQKYWRIQMRKMGSAALSECHFTKQKHLRF